MADVRQHTEQLLLEGLVDDGVLQMEADLFVHIGAVEGGPLRALGHHLVAYGIGRHTVSSIGCVTAPVLRADLLLAAHVKRLVAHIVA